MSSPPLPKYQIIYQNLRQRILDGEFAAGSRLPPQQQLASQFDVTLMTLRQAVAALESDGLVWASRGKGTFISDRPVDIRIGNLSSFAEQMEAAGVTMETELLGSNTLPACQHAGAARALDTDDDLLQITRLRSVEGQPISLQRSYLRAGVLPEPLAIEGDSLYRTIHAATGSEVSEAIESITAVAVEAGDAQLVALPAGSPALLSTRTSIDQAQQPFLFDEAILVPGRCTVTADRTSDRMSLTYGLHSG